VVRSLSDLLADDAVITLDWTPNNRGVSRLLTYTYDT
jgi:hypothetical protein